MADSSKQWVQFLNRNSSLPLPGERNEETQDAQSVGYSLSLQAIEGINEPEQGGKRTEYEIRVSLFDIIYKKFFGRTWVGPAKSVKSSASQKARLQYNVPVYFHTSLNDPNIVIVVEIVGIITTKKNKVQRVSCGWGIIRIFKDGHLGDLSSPTPEPVKRMDVYHGSPRALLYLDDDIEKNEKITLIAECQLCYVIRTHKLLRKVMHLLPENIIAGSNSIIPGLYSQDDKLQIYLYPTIEKFEEELCKLLNADRLARDDIPSDANVVHINERRLQVGVHNGWGYVQPPQTYMLVSDAVSKGGRGSMRKSKGRPTSAGSRESLSTALILKNKVRLELIEDPLFAVVFNLEYMLSVPVSTTDRKLSTSMNRVQSRNVSLRWAAWTPFAHDGMAEITLQLQGDPIPNPDSVLVFKNPDVEMTDQEASKIAPGRIQFMFRTKKDMSSSRPGSAASMRSESFRQGFDSYRSTGQATHMETSMDVGMPHYQTGLAPHEQSSVEGSMLGESHPSQYPARPPIPKGSPRTPRSMQMGTPNGMMMGLPPVPPQQQYYGQQQIYSSIQPIPHSGTGNVYPVEIKHLEASTARTVSPDQLTELPFTPVHAPIMPVGQLQQTGPSLTRASYARLYQAGFPPVLDRNGEPPEVVDPNDYVTFHPQHEDADPLQINEIVLQFLAFSRMVQFENQGQPRQHNTIFFTFQFYRYPQITTERLFLGEVDGGLSADPSSLPCILQKLSKDGTILEGPPGVTTRGGSVRPVGVTTILKGRLHLRMANIGHPIEVKLLKAGNTHLQKSRVVVQDEGSGTFLGGSLNTISSPKYYCNISTKYAQRQYSDHFNRYLVPICLFCGILLKAQFRPGEGKMFVRFLYQQTLHIDVWDGDSLLLIGSCALPLKHLLRSGRDAVQVTHELDVITTEYTEDSPALTGDLTRGGSVRPVGVTTILKGRLHLRMANIGHPIEVKLLKAGNTHLQKSRVVVQDEGSGTFLGGSLNTISSPKLSLYAGMKLTRTYRAAHMADTDRELAALLFSRKDKAVLQDSNREADEVKKRKLNRMEAIRKNESENGLISTLLIKKEEKIQRARDLKTIEVYRERSKKEGIRSMLQSAITTEHTIHPSFGHAEFFEFILKNPYNVQHTVYIQCDDPDLQVVTDTREWRHYKQLTETYTPVEENMFSGEAQNDLPGIQVFLRPKESINIPLKYQSFKADHSVHPQGPYNPHRPLINMQMPEQNKVDLSLQSRNTKVYFKTGDDRPIAILSLNIEPQPQIVDQTFRFHHPEQSFLKKSVRLPPFQSLPGAPVGGAGLHGLFVRCSDPNVICESKRVAPGEPQDVFIKVACGASPAIKKFFIIIYGDQFLSRPVQTWQFYIHALQRVDVTCVEGQTSRFSLILRGTQSSRLTQCFSSHPIEMQISPVEPFMLLANSVHEIHVGVRPTSVGSKFMYINVVDTEYHQLVRSWLICVTCRQPVISKAFELQLPVGGGKGSNKRISYTNPYPYKKVFNLRSNRDDLLQFKETKIEIGAGQVHTIGLRFTPSQVPGSAEILIFINDAEDKNEETFCVKAIYM
uniref:Nephrocystin-4-like n=1 Tax=Saccoglossus kowalevskii TaxID=10224 RepID=A0ABM0MIP8_SACKO|nr:PREDICTED: nephrocystin-4-like [Saccoglossus kowalevskii]